MVSIFYKISAVAMCVSATDRANWDWQQMSQSREVVGTDVNTFKHFDTNYMMGLLGTDGQDNTVVHQHHPMPTVGLTSMEKVMSLTARSTRASIRKQLVDLLKKQVSIESMYSSKKEKLYIAASAVYQFIARLLQSACNIAISNDGLWHEQMQCFSAYRQLLEVYSMWNEVRDIAFALEHGMSVTPESLAVCGSEAVSQERFAGQDFTAQRLQNQYLVSATLRSCYDSLQVKIEALRRWLSNLLISVETSQDRGASCLFRTITVLTCLSSGNQENILNLAIKEEHKQHVIFSLSRYASVALRDAQEQQGAVEGEERPQESFASLIQVDSDKNLRDVRKIGQ